MYQKKLFNKFTEFTECFYLAKSQGISYEFFRQDWANLNSMFPDYTSYYMDWKLED